MRNHKYTFHVVLCSALRIPQSLIVPPTEWHTSQGSAHRARMFSTNTVTREIGSLLQFSYWSSRVTSTGQWRGHRALKSPRLYQCSRLFRSTSTTATVPNCFAWAITFPS